MVHGSGFREERKMWGMYLYYSLRKLKKYNNQKSYIVQWCHSCLNFCQGTHAVYTMMKLPRASVPSISSHVKELKYPVSDMILWKSPDEIPLSTWSFLNGQGIWIYEEENSSGYRGSCIVGEGMSASMIPRCFSCRDVNAESLPWRRATPVDSLAWCGQQRPIPGPQPGYSTWRGRNAVYTLLKSLESLTLARLCDVEDSIMHFIWGMEKEFGRLLHGRFQVVKLVFHPVRDKSQWNSKRWQAKVWRQGTENGSFPQMCRGEPKSGLEMSALHICGQSLRTGKKRLQTSTTDDGTVWDWDVSQIFGPKLMLRLERWLDHEDTELISGRLGGSIWRLVLERDFFSWTSSLLILCSLDPLRWEVLQCLILFFFGQDILSQHKCTVTWPTKTWKARTLWNFELK